MSTSHHGYPSGDHGQGKTFQPGEISTIGKHTLDRLSKELKEIQSRTYLDYQADPLPPSASGRLADWYRETAIWTEHRLKAKIPDLKARLDFQLGTERDGEKKTLLDRLEEFDKLIDPAREQWSEILLTTRAEKLVEALHRREQELARNNANLGVAPDKNPAEQTLHRLAVHVEKQFDAIGKRQQIEVADRGSLALEPLAGITSALGEDTKLLPGRQILLQRYFVQIAKAKDKPGDWWSQQKKAARKECDIDHRKEFDKTFDKGFGDHLDRITSELKLSEKSTREDRLSLLEKLTWFSKTAAEYRYKIDTLSMPLSAKQEFALSLQATVQVVIERFKLLTAAALQSEV
jgi:hypothetical protein